MASLFFFKRLCTPLSDSDCLQCQLLWSVLTVVVIVSMVESVSFGSDGVLRWGGLATIISCAVRLLVVYWC